MARTLAQAQADYDAVHAAYLKALDAESYSTGEGASLTRPKSETLYKQMMTLDAEIARLTRGGMRIRGGTPT